MPRPGRPTTERAKDFKGTLRQLLAAMSRYKLSLIVVVVFAILSTIFNIAGPKILAKATTALATGWIAKLRGVGSIDFAYIGRVLLFLAGMYLFSAAFSFLQGWLMTGLSQKVCYDFRDQINKKINRLLTGVKSPMQLTDAGNGHKVTVSFDESVFSNGVLWQQDAESFVCMEPWNGWANSVNEAGHHIELNPGESKEFKWSVTIE